MHSINSIAMNEMTRNTNTNSRVSYNKQWSKNSNIYCVNVSQSGGFHAMIQCGLNQKKKKMLTEQNKQSMNYIYTLELQLCDK